MNRKNLVKLRLSIMSFAVVFLALACTSSPMRSAKNDLSADRFQRRGLASVENFPDVVSIKDGRQTFNNFFYYVLDDSGRIWFKPITIKQRPETKKIAPVWQLLGSGLPENPKVHGFAKPKRIISIHADADEIMAVSDEFRHYSMRWLQNPVFPGKPRQWTDVHGWPVEEPLVWNERVKDNRGWGIGRRNQVVKYFEDVDGKSFTGGGGLTSYYFLTADGTEIAFTDSGLPSDFSHTMCGPRRGTFIAEGFDVSASTMFLINKQGEMFTRMADFDTDGSDVMFFEYTYDRSNKKKSLVSLPSEDWLAHARIFDANNPPVGKASISSQITIALTGEGNRGRQLRVAGYDEAGRPGYYWKEIFLQKRDSSYREERTRWTFQSVPGLYIDPIRLLSYEHVTATEPVSRAPLRDFSAEGKILVDGEEAPFRVALTDFNLQCSPAILRVTAEGQSVDLIFHTVEQWYHQKRLNPGRDGTPKNLLGTLEIPEAALETPHPALRRVIDQYFKPYQYVMGAFWVEATDEYVSVSPRIQIRRAPSLTFDLSREGRGYPSVKAARRETLHQDGFTKLAQSENLKVERPLKTLKEADISELTALVQKNLSTINFLKSAYAESDRIEEKVPFYGTESGFQKLKVAGTALFGASYWAPALKTLCKNMPPLLYKNTEYRQLMLLISSEDYDHALQLLNNRIAAYELRIAELRGSVKATDWIYYETLPEYWKHLEFGLAQTKTVDPLSQSYRMGCAVNVDDRLMSDSDSTQSGILLDLRCGSEFKGGRLVLRVRPKQFEKDFFTASKKGVPVGGAGNSFQTPVTVTLDYTDDSPASRAVLERIFVKPENRETESVSSTLKIEEGRYELNLGLLRTDWLR